MSRHHPMGEIEKLRARKHIRRDATSLLEQRGSNASRVRFLELDKSSHSTHSQRLPMLPTSELSSSSIGTKTYGGRMGSKTERYRSARIDKLSLPNNRTMPHRPPTAGTAMLPGINNRYSRPVRTPTKERSAGERGGHAGMVTKRSRNMLGNDMVTPLLDMAAYSLNAETQDLVAPAMAALAGVASNRKVLASFGAVDVMLRLAQTGQTLQTRKDAWDAILQLIRSSQACQRLFELDGLDLAMRCSSDPHAAIRRKAANVVARLLSKDTTLKIAERTSLKNISGLCAFVTSADAATSLAAGAALLKVVKSSLEVMVKIDTLCLDQIVHAVVTGNSVVHVISPDRTLINKGHSNALQALALLTTDKEICSRLARADSLALVLKKLYEHGVAIGRSCSEEDVFFSRIIANLCMTCRTNDLLADTEVLKNLIAAMPRMLLMLHEAMPRESDNPFKSKSSSVTSSVDQLLLPSEIELQHNLVLSIGRFMFCMFSARHDLFLAGYLPSLIELSRSRTIKIRQNASICIFYLVQDKSVQEEFGSASAGPGHKPVDPYMAIIELFKNCTDMLVRLTLLRTIKSLTHTAKNVVEFERRGVMQQLGEVLEVANGLAKQDGEDVQSQQIFPILKCAFCATDIIFAMEQMAVEANETPDGRLMMRRVSSKMHGMLDDEKDGKMDGNGKRVIKGVIKAVGDEVAKEEGSERPGRHLMGRRGSQSDRRPPSPTLKSRREAKHDEIEARHHEMEKAVQEVGLEKMAHESMLLYLDAFHEIAVSAMAGNETKQHLEAAAKTDSRAADVLKGIELAAKKSRKSNEHDEERLRKIFRRYDDDNSDTIDGDELYSLLRDLGHLCTRDEAMRIMSGMDSSGDGSVDFREFESWWTNAPFTSMFASSNINR